MSSSVNYVGPQDKYPKAKLVEPAMSGYLFFALEFDPISLFKYYSEGIIKEDALKAITEFSDLLSNHPDVLRSTVFKALMRPPGIQKIIDKHPKLKIAKYDIVMLVEFTEQIGKK